MTSALCLIGLYFMITYVISAISDHKYYSAIPTMLVIGLFIFFALKMPYCTYIKKGTVVIKQILGSIRITDIRSIKPIAEKDLKNATRTLGNGGFLGYVGKFNSPNLGKFYMAAINTKELVKITTFSGKIHVINYPYELCKKQI